MTPAQLLIAIVAVILVVIFVKFAMNAAISLVKIVIVIAGILILAYFAYNYLGGPEYVGRAIDGIKDQINNTIQNITEQAIDKVNDITDITN